MPPSPKAKGANTITSVHDLMNQAALLRGNSRHQHVRYWFRGQSDASWDLQPGVYRLTFPAKDENDRLNTERHLNQDFRVWSAGHLKETLDDADLYFLQQHYKMPTRLLDWTTNPLAALFFAVTENLTADASIYMMDSYQLSPHQGAKDFHGILTSRNPVFKQAIGPIVNWTGDHTNFPAIIMPVRPNHFDHRVTLQRSCFTFHVPMHRILTTNENNTLKTYTIPGGKTKSQLRAELSLLGIDYYSIYGDLENLSTMLKGAYQIK